MPDQHLRWMGRHVQNTLIGPFLQDLPGELYAVASGHHDIHHQKVHAPACLTKNVESLGAAIGLQHAIAFFGQNTVRQPAGDSLVINDEDRCGRVGERSSQPSLLGQGNQGRWVDPKRVGGFLAIVSSRSR